jgi:hypothetical protein
MKSIAKRYLAVPRLLRHLFEQALLGSIIGVTFAAMVVMTDFAGIGSRLMASDVWLTASFLYFSSFAVTFATGMIATSMLFDLD